ncbi:MAG: response regulator [Deltaproteobacteria bacterium]|nr:response regulator [Deltaproteobacteria bacterium]
MKKVTTPTTCPYTGLKIVQHPKWKDFPTGSSYSSSLARIGNHIYLSIGKGDLATIDNRLLNAYQQFLDEEFSEYPVVEIKNLGNAKGIIGKKVRNDTKKFYERNHDKLAAVIYFNGSLQMKMLLKALNTIYSGPIETYICNDYRDALHKAREVIKDKKKKIRDPAKTSFAAHAVEHGHTDDSKNADAVSISKKDIQQVIDYILSFIWDREEKTGHQHDTLPVSEGHPLEKIFETLVIFKSDLIAAQDKLRLQAKDAQALAQKAEEANRSKSSFLANMSHEIRTPMNGVLGMNALLLQTELNDEQREYALTVHSSAEALLTIINDILDFSKIEAGRLELEDVDFNFHLMMSDLGKIMTFRAEEKNIQFISTINPEIPAQFIGDPGRLRQILINIIGNAIKFTQVGEVRVTCEAVEKADADTLLRFDVSDTGIGIPEDKQSLLFQSFSQADASTTRKFGGTGLGLTIARQLTNMLGGEIGFESRQGEGSNFWFTVRLKNTSQQETSRSTVEIGGKRILYIDNNEANRRFVTRQLKSWDIKVTTVDSAPDGLHQLYTAHEEKKPFDALIADMMMQGMEGPTLARIVLQDERLKHTRVVMMSSLGKRGDAAEMKRLGVSAYLTKPVAAFELYECLQEVFGAGQQNQSDTPLITRHSLTEKRLSRQRILVAEDNIINQKVAVGILSKMGYKVATVNNGKDAVEALQRGWYDLVFMDIQMPVMDGFEATREIRAQQTGMLNKKVPIIAMTAHAMSGYREKCLAAGMDDYVSKPIGVQALSTVLEKWLSHSNSLGNGSIDAGPVPKASFTPNIPVPFDRDAFIKRMMYDEPLAHRIIDEFLKDMPNQVEILLKGMDDKDFKLVEAQAHKIKGSAANICAFPLSEAAYRIEKAPSNKLTDDEFIALMENLKMAWKDLSFNLTGQV